MSLKRRTVVDQIEITRTGTVQVRLAKTIMDGEAVVASTFHRCTFEPGANVEEGIAAVNAHLAQLGEANLDGSEIERITRVTALEHSETAITARQERLRRRNEA
jgi:hypothetical protein